MNYIYNNARLNPNMNYAVIFKLYREYFNYKKNNKKENNKKENNQLINRNDIMVVDKNPENIEYSHIHKKKKFTDAKGQVFQEEFDVKQNTQENGNIISTNIHKKTYMDETGNVYEEETKQNDNETNDNGTNDNGTNDNGTNDNPIEEDIILSHIGHTVSIAVFHNKIYYIDPQAEVYQEINDINTVVNYLTTLGFLFIDIIFTVNSLYSNKPTLNKNDILNMIHSGINKISVVIRDKHTTHGGKNTKRRRKKENIKKKTQKRKYKKENTKVIKRRYKSYKKKIQKL
jgi:hypothetical protein